MKTIKKIKKKDKIEFIYNSNLIEEIHYNIKLYNKYEKSNFPEIQGHSYALEYVLENYKEDLSEKHILSIHGLLTKDLVQDKYRGRYRDIPVYIGGREAIYAVAIKPAMECLVVDSKDVWTQKECWAIHDRFEIIHPFVDGNGRTGRLILAWLFLKEKLGLPIVDIEDRFKYYNKIEEYRLKHLGFISNILNRDTFENIP